MRAFLFVFGLAVLALVPALPAAATQPEAVTIETSRLRGEPGTFSAEGAIADAGTFATENHNFGGIGAPTFFVVNTIYVFEGALGTFTLRTHIENSLTATPNIWTSDGTWVVQGGTGAYRDLRGQGEVTGTIDETAEPALFLRTFTGDVH